MENEKTFKCVKCHKPDIPDDFEYCPNCGYAVDSNFCSNNDCPLNDTDEPVSLEETDCFCSCCGSEAKYYVDGFIKPIPYD
jgi:hypothetical protein